MHDCILLPLTIERCVTMHGEVRLVYVSVSASHLHGIATYHGDHGDVDALDIPMHAYRSPSSVAVGDADCCGSDPGMLALPSQSIAGRKVLGGADRCSLPLCYKAYQHSLPHLAMSVPLAPS